MQDYSELCDLVQSVLRHGGADESVDECGQALRRPKNLNWLKLPLGEPPSAESKKELQSQQVTVGNQRQALSQEDVQKFLTLSQEIQRKEVDVVEMFLKVKQAPDRRALADQLGCTEHDLEDNDTAVHYMHYYERGMRLDVLNDLIKGRQMCVSGDIAPAGRALVLQYTNLLLRGGVSNTLAGRSPPLGSNEGLAARLMRSFTLLLGDVSVARDNVKTAREAAAVKDLHKVAECLFYLYYQTQILPDEARLLVATIEDASRKIKDMSEKRPNEDKPLLFATSVLALALVVALREGVSATSLQLDVLDRDELLGRGGGGIGGGGGGMGGLDEGVLRGDNEVADDTKLLRELKTKLWPDPNTRGVGQGASNQAWAHGGLQGICLLALGRLVTRAGANASREDGPGGVAAESKSSEAAATMASKKSSDGGMPLNEMLDHVRELETFTFITDNILLAPGLQRGASTEDTSIFVTAILQNLVVNYIEFETTERQGGHGGHGGHGHRRGRSQRDVFGRLPKCRYEIAEHAAQLRATGRTDTAGARKTEDALEEIMACVAALCRLSVSSPPLPRLFWDPPKELNCGFLLKNFLEPAADLTNELAGDGPEATALYVQLVRLFAALACPLEHPGAGGEAQVIMGGAGGGGGGQGAGDMSCAEAAYNFLKNLGQPKRRGAERGESVFLSFDRFFETIAALPEMFLQPVDGGGDYYDDAGNDRGPAEGGRDRYGQFQQHAAHAAVVRGEPQAQDMFELSQDDTTALEAFMHLLQVVLRCDGVREAIWATRIPQNDPDGRNMRGGMGARGGTQVHNALLHLVCSPVPASLKGEVFRTLAVFATTPAYASVIWDCLEENQVLATLPTPALDESLARRDGAGGRGRQHLDGRRGGYGQYGGQRGGARWGGQAAQWGGANRYGGAEGGLMAEQDGVLAELDQVESEDRTYPATTGFMVLLDALLAHTDRALLSELASSRGLGAGRRVPGFGPHLQLVMTSVFLNYDIRKYQPAKLGEMWRVAACSLGIMLRFLRRYRVSMSDASCPTIEDDFKWEGIEVEYEDGGAGETVRCKAAKSPGFTLLTELLSGGHLFSKILSLLTDHGGVMALEAAVDEAASGVDTPAAAMAGMGGMGGGVGGVAPQAEAFGAAGNAGRGGDGGDGIIIAIKPLTTLRDKDDWTSWRQLATQRAIEILWAALECDGEFLASVRANPHEAPVAADFVSDGFVGGGLVPMATLLFQKGPKFLELLRYIQYPHCPAIPLCVTQILYRVSRTVKPDELVGVLSPFSGAQLLVDAVARRLRQAPWPGAGEGATHGGGGAMTGSAVDQLATLSMTEEHLLACGPIGRLEALSDLEAGLNDSGDDGSGEGGGMGGARSREESDERVRQTLLQLLIANLDSAPGGSNISHLLLGLPCIGSRGGPLTGVQAVSARGPQRPPMGPLGEPGFACLDVLLDLLDSPNFIHDSPVLAADCFRLFYELVSRPASAPYMIPFLWNTREFYKRHLARLVAPDPRAEQQGAFGPADPRVPHATGLGLQSEGVELPLWQHKRQLAQSMLRGWLLRGAAIDLFYAVLDDTPDTSHAHQILDLLFTVQPVNGTLPRPGYQNPAAERQLATLEILGSMSCSSLNRRPGVPPAAAQRCPPGMIEECLLPCQMGLGDSAFQKIQPELLLQQLAQNRELTSEQEARDVLQWALRWNRFNEAAAATAHATDSWRTLMQVAMYKDCFAVLVGPGGPCAGGGIEATASSTQKLLVELLKGTIDALIDQPGLTMGIAEPIAAIVVTLCAQLRQQAVRPGEGTGDGLGSGDMWDSGVGQQQHRVALNLLVDGRHDGSGVGGMGGGHGDMQETKRAHAGMMDIRHTDDVGGGFSHGGRHGRDRDRRGGERDRFGMGGDGGESKGGHGGGRGDRLGGNGSSVFDGLPSQSLYGGSPSRGGYGGASNNPWGEASAKAIIPPPHQCHEIIRGLLAALLRRGRPGAGGASSSSASGSGSTHVFRGTLMTALLHILHLVQSASKAGDGDSTASSGGGLYSHPLASGEGARRRTYEEGTVLALEEAGAPILEMMVQDALAGSEGWRPVAMCALSALVSRDRVGQWRAQLCNRGHLQQLLGTFSRIDDVWRSAHDLGSDAPITDFLHESTMACLARIAQTREGAEALVHNEAIPKIGKLAAVAFWHRVNGQGQQWEDDDDAAAGGDGAPGLDSQQAVSLLLPVFLLIRTLLAQLPSGHQQLTEQVLTFMRGPTGKARLILHILRCRRPSLATLRLVATTAATVAKVALDGNIAGGVQGAGAEDSAFER